MYQSFVKRVLDVLAAGTGLVILLPVVLVCAVGVRIALGSPVLFSQERPGLAGKPFRIIKFRTMRNAIGRDGRVLPDAARMTSFGRLLRSLSLDELPELWNVLRGDMSIVGPRPLLSRYTDYMTEVERRRFLVRPGITGLAQIRGRNNLSWDDRLSSDVEYVSRISLSTDLAIIARTAICVLARRGFQDDPESVMQNLDDERSGRKVPLRRTVSSP